MEMYTPCHHAFIGYCRGLTSNREDARDLAGETVLIVFENLEKLRKKDSFKAYLFGVARRSQLHQYRRNRFRGEFDEKVAEMLPAHESPPDINHDVEVLYNLLGKLPPKQRESIVLFELSGFSLEEIRQLQGGTLSGVKSRLKRGREQLRIWLLDPAVNEGSRHKAQGSGKEEGIKTRGMKERISNPGLQAGDDPVPQERRNADDSK
ncbi:MAG: sigma-70 family RNA polymerase sigma factor [Bacteroidia bacterium]|nr:sigma-70 family RNA polymerase sigma factor [Bacteroidia bacterium]